MSTTETTIARDQPAPGVILPATIIVELPVRLHRDTDGVLWADVPALPGCVSGGDTPGETLANLKEAAEGWLMARHELETQGWPQHTTSQ
jgi:predicted RNase H-like HicB family nuclease